MHGPTLCSDAMFIAKDKAILYNLILEQEDTRVARGLENQPTKFIEDDCI